MTKRDEQRRALIEKWFAEALACTDVQRSEMDVGLALEGKGGKLRSASGTLRYLRRERGGG